MSTPRTFSHSSLVTASPPEESGSTNCILKFETRRAQTIRGNVTYPQKCATEAKIWVPSAGAQDEVHAALRIDNVTDLAHLQRKRRIFKRLLHLPRSEPAQVAILLVGGAVRVLAREPAKLPISFPYPFKIAMASSFERVMLTCQDAYLATEKKSTDGGDRRWTKGMTTCLFPAHRSVCWETPHRPLRLRIMEIWQLSRVRERISQPDCRSPSR